jgi:hypothetical protein
MKADKDNQSRCESLISYFSIGTTNRFSFSRHLFFKFTINSFEIRSLGITNSPKPS